LQRFIKRRNKDFSFGYIFAYWKNRFQISNVNNYVQFGSHDSLLHTSCRAQGSKLKAKPGSHEMAGTEACPHKELREIRFLPSL
jgi:hypothetical protein